MLVDIPHRIAWGYVDLRNVLNPFVATHCLWDAGVDSVGPHRPRGVP